MHRLAGKYKRLTTIALIALAALIGGASFASAQGPRSNLPARIPPAPSTVTTPPAGELPAAPTTATPPAPVAVEWMGHSTFQITSSRGTRILTDPHGAFDLPHPTLPQDIVTTSHQHGPHNSVHMAPGRPVILHGLTPTGEDWQKISTTIRDVSVFVVPAFLQYLF